MTSECTALKELIAWYEAFEPNLPVVQFSLRPGVRVTEPRKFYAAIAEDIQSWRRDPESARARFGGLETDLFDLKKLIDEGCGQ